MYNGRFNQKPIETGYDHSNSMSEYERYLVLLDMERNGVLGRNFVVYGSIENPLFKAKDIRQCLDLTNVTDIISRVDSDEVTKLNLGGLNREYLRYV